uniref:Uncharacterized protein n=1 Tax=Pipistrellus kuhlii TaxID=59472 RepID=A0A7J8B1M9_PIPKU|nr:hypothetical protein mPipKuh1_007775 [Pipistrellus kuhlii]
MSQAQERPMVCVREVVSQIHLLGHFLGKPICLTLLTRLPPLTALVHLPNLLPSLRPSYLSLSLTNTSSLGCRNHPWGPCLNSHQLSSMVNSRLEQRSLWYLLLGSTAQTAPRGPPSTPNASLSSLAPSPGGPDIQEPAGHRDIIQTVLSCQHIFLLPPRVEKGMMSQSLPSQNPERTARSAEWGV